MYSDSLVTGQKDNLIMSDPELRCPSISPPRRLHVWEAGVPLEDSFEPNDRWDGALWA